MKIAKECLIDLEVQGQQGDTSRKRFLMSTNKANLTAADINSIVN